MIDLTFRPATMEDADMLLEWRNDDESRKQSRTTDLIERPRHIEWLTELLAASNRRQSIAVINGKAVGWVRVEEWEPNICEISWLVAPEERGKKISKPMVKAITDGLKNQIWAHIKPGNPASVKIAEHVGMRFEREEKNGLLRYFRP
jgi:RimJ/RimL family protein N-acetyltransferase